MENLVFSLNVTLPIFLTIVIGYFLRQIKLLDGNFVKTLDKLNFKVTLPALVFLDLYEADFYQVWDTKFVLFCFIVTFLCILVIFCLTKIFCKKKEIIGEFVQASYRGSAALMGLALIQSIYGHASLGPLMIIGSVPLYNIAAVILLSFTAPGKGKPTRKQLLDSFKGVFTNPIIIGIALGLIASLLRVKLPYIGEKTISNLAAVATPLALLGLGAGFEKNAALGLWKPTLLVAFIRLVGQCALFLPLAIKLGFTGESLIAILVMLGAPTTPSCYIMAKNMGHDGTISSTSVIITTLLSSLTITFWLFLLKSMQII